MTKRKRMPKRMLMQLENLRKDFTIGPLKRNVCLARIDYLLEWSGSEYVKVMTKNRLKKSVRYVREGTASER